MNILHDYKKEIFDLGKINELSITNVKKLIEDSEELYHKQVDDVADEIVKNGEYKIILLAGPSSSGKTTTSNLLRKNLAKHGYESVVVSLDDFFVDRELTPRLPNGDYDYENITTLDLDYLNKFADDLFAKGKALMPTFNFITGRREKEYKNLELTNKTIVIMEGIHALNPILFKNHNSQMYKIYICVNTNFEIDNQMLMPAQKVRLMRRLIRDINNRGMSLEDTFHVWTNVLAGEDIYIKPYKNTADYLINSTHAYEPLMYAYKLLPLLKKEGINNNTQPLINMLEKCEKLSPKLLPENSLLHEFLD
ncbi:MAG: nucleoside kinase [Clostridiales bacterium]|nr:nucleoside kinase [Clostridiales bacterium]